MIHKIKRKSYTDTGRNFGTETFSSHAYINHNKWTLLNHETAKRNSETPERNSETTRFILFLVKGINYMYIVRRDEIKSLIKLQRHQHIIVSV